VRTRFAGNAEAASDFLLQTAEHAVLQKEAAREAGEASYTEWVLVVLNHKELPGMVSLH
jgi:hypothetical protein